MGFLRDIGAPGVIVLITLVLNVYLNLENQSEKCSHHLKNQFRD